MCCRSRLGLELDRDVELLNFELAADVLAAGSFARAGTASTNASLGPLALQSEAKRAAVKLVVQPAGFEHDAWPRSFVTDEKVLHGHRPRSASTRATIRRSTNRALIEARPGRKLRFNGC